MREGTDSRCTTTATVRGTRLCASGVSRFLLPTFLCGRQRKVGAAPHRGNANRPITKQGKAKKNARKGQRECKERPNRKANQKSSRRQRAKSKKAKSRTETKPCIH